MADISISGEIVELPLKMIGERFAPLRIVNPEADRVVLRSMERYGQLTPVIVSESGGDSYELIDGFKRLRGARVLSFSRLSARKLQLTVRAGKAAILQLNRAGRSINTLEEALVVHSLFHEEGLAQVEIATLLGRHKSWVSRRIALIDRLSDEVRERIKLGLLPVSMGRELVRLPRGNQEEVAEAVHKHGLSCRELRQLIDLLQTSPHDQTSILWQPRECLKSPGEIDSAVNTGLSPLAREIHRKLLTLEKYCLNVSFAVQTTILAQFEEDEEKLLLNCCAQVATALERTGNELRQLEEE